MNIDQWPEYILCLAIRDPEVKLSCTYRENTSEKTGRVRETA